MSVSILIGDCRETLKGMEAGSVNCCVTSPPYFGLRDYGMADQIGLEHTPDAFVSELVSVFREVRRVLRDDGTLWLNLGDSYAGSGRGGNPDAGTKQGTNKGSQTIGVLYGRDEDAAQERERVKAQFAAEKAFGLKPKDLIGIPWRVAFALQADGWYLRQDIIWHKPNPMPESVTDRCTKAHEYVFLLSKAQRYHFDAKAIAEAGVGRETYFGSDRYSAGSGRNDSGSYNDDECTTRNKRSVWTIATRPFSEAHFATMAPDLAETCIKAGCPVGGTVLDPFGGAGTTGLVADRLGRNAVLCELNPEYVSIARNRISDDAGMFGAVA